jgi:hypothetical protein
MRSNHPAISIDRARAYPTPPRLHQPQILRLPKKRRPRKPQDLRRLRAIPIRLNDRLLKAPALTRNQRNSIASHQRLRNPREDRNF